MIIFTGGIGENDYLTRREVCKGLEFLGVEFDEAVNEGLRGKDQILSKPTSRVKVALVTTNEELVIARETKHLVK
jgi:acetate kinase